MTKIIIEQKTTSCDSIDCSPGTCLHTNDSPVCICPLKHSGPHCKNHSIVQNCPDGHACLHGSNCVKHPKIKPESEDRYYCDCSTSKSHHEFGGSMCEFEATEYCEFGLGMSKSFCTNGGTCKAVNPSGKEPSHIGCNCPEGFEGEHCQYQFGVYPRVDDVSEENESLIYAHFLSYAIPMVVIILIYILIRMRQRRSTIEKIEMEEIANTLWARADSTSGGAYCQVHSKDELRKGGAANSRLVLRRVSI